MTKNNKKFLLLFIIMTFGCSINDSNMQQKLLDNNSTSHNNYSSVDLFVNQNLPQNQYNNDDEKEYTYLIVKAFYLDNDDILKNVNRVKNPNILNILKQKINDLKTYNETQKALNQILHNVLPKEIIYIILNNVIKKPLLDYEIKQNSIVKLLRISKKYKLAEDLCDIEYAETKKIYDFYSFLKYSCCCKNHVDKMNYKNYSDTICTLQKQSKKCMKISYLSFMCSLLLFVIVYNPWFYSKWFFIFSFSFCSILFAILILSVFGYCILSNMNDFNSSKRKEKIIYKICKVFCHK